MPSDQPQDYNTQAITKFSQLVTLFNQRRNEKYFEAILQNQLDIDCQVPPDAYLKAHKPDIIGCTALHLAVEMEHLGIVNRLLDLGTDFTINNRNGSTALHLAIENGADERSGWKHNGKLDNSFVHPILKRHIVTCNPTNPSNKNGISHFHAACVTNYTDAVEFFLDNGIPIDQTVNSDSPIFGGYTGLHFAARCCAVESMALLLERGADVEIRDARQMTAMHLLIERNIEIVESINRDETACENNACTDDLHKNIAMMMMSLMASRRRRHHGRHETHEEIIDPVGLSHFHVACTTRDVRMVERMIDEQNHKIDRQINVDSPVWPGYTPLHFAAVSYNFETVKLLVTRGANLETKDANGLTALELCLERYGFEEIEQLLSSRDTWREIILSNNHTRLSNLTLAMRDTSTFDALLRNIDNSSDNPVNMRVPSDSPLWPGNTLLHLAVTLYEATRRNYGSSNALQLIDECLRLGAEVTTKNADGHTPLHLAFRASREDVVDRMLRHHHSFDNPIDTATGLSHLHIACAANDMFSVVNLLMDTVAASDSVALPLRTSFKWYGTLRNMFGLSRRCVVHLNAGATPLHIAVAVGSVEIAQLLLKRGADLYAKDADGLTPIHRVLTSCDRVNIGRALLQFSSLESIRECRTQMGLTHLHVASFVNQVDVMTSLLMDGQGTDVNVAIDGDDSQFSKNISVDMCDNPFTYVSSMSITRNPGDADDAHANNAVIAAAAAQISVTLQENHPREQRTYTSTVAMMVDPYGESAKYLDRYAGFTPLHFAMRGESRDAVQLLVDRGADILARANGELTPLYDTLNCVYDYLELFVSILQTNVELAKRVRDETGITMLHIACHKIDVDMVKDLLSSRDVDDVDAVTNDDSPVWPRHTALHVLMTRWEHNDLGNGGNYRMGINDVMTMLLDRGADVTRVNADLDTPLHIAERLLRAVDGDPIDSPSRICMNLLLNQHTNFEVNPVNSRGKSFFHIACHMNDLDIVREYLDSRTNVDVNRKIGYFVDERAGESPLMLAVKSFAKRFLGVERQLEVVDLLLERGADVHAEDAFRNTPLHAAVEWGLTRESVIERLIGHGANIYAKNIFGDTPLEKLLRSFSTTSVEVEVFLRHGFAANTFNEITGEGLMSMPFTRRFDNFVQTSIFETMMKFCDVKQSDDKGRTVLHNIVSNRHPIVLMIPDDFVDLFEKLTGFGIDIDAQDETGKTALHTATRFRNYRAVSSLLKSGADVNVSDSSGNPAFAYFLEPSDLDEDDEDDDENATELTMKTFVQHLQKLQRCELEFSELNGMIRDRAVEKYDFAFDDNGFNEEIVKAKNTKIGSRSSTFNLHDFLSECGAVAAYPSMSQLDRDAVIEFFETTCKFTLHREFNGLVGLLKLQYRKALKRLQLFEPAKVALLDLVPCALPDLCSEAILRFLSNSELTTLISLVVHVASARKRMRMQ